MGEEVIIPTNTAEPASNPEITQKMSRDSLFDPISVYAASFLSQLERLQAAKWKPGKIKFPGETSS